MNSLLKEMGSWLSKYHDMGFINDQAKQHTFTLNQSMIFEFISVIGSNLHLDTEDFKTSMKRWAADAADIFNRSQKGIEEAFDELSLLRQELWSRLEFGYEHDVFSLEVNIFQIGSMLNRKSDSTVFYLSEAFEELYREEFARKERLLKKQESVISELSVPMIASIIPDTVLVPLTGYLAVDRLDHIRSKLLHSVAQERMTTVVIDLTGITSLEVSSLGLQELAFQIEHLTASLRLMGVEAIFVGFSPELSQGIVQAGIQLDVPVFSNFRSSLAYLMDQKKLTLMDLT